MTRSSVGPAPVTVRPATRTAPAAGATSRLSERRSVVLPLPLRPSTTTNSPGRTVRSTASTATTSGGNVTRSPETAIMAVTPGAARAAGSARTGSEQLHGGPHWIVVAVVGRGEAVDLVQALEQIGVLRRTDLQERGAALGEGGGMEPGAGGDAGLGNLRRLGDEDDALALGRVAQVLLAGEVERGDSVHVAVEQRPHGRVVPAPEHDLLEEALGCTSTQ